MVLLQVERGLENTHQHHYCCRLADCIARGTIPSPRRRGVAALRLVGGRLDFLVGITTHLQPIQRTRFMFKRRQIVDTTVQLWPRQWLVAVGGLATTGELGKTKVVLCVNMTR